MTTRAPVPPRPRRETAPALTSKRRHLALMILALGAVLTAVVWATPLPDDGAELPPCATEDSVSCYWDADTMGNGRGRSFTVDADGVVTYTN